MCLGLKYILKWNFFSLPLLFRAINHKLWLPLPCLSLGERGEEQLMSKESPNSSDCFSQALKCRNYKEK